MTTSAESAVDDQDDVMLGTAVALLHQQGEVALVELLIDVEHVTYDWQGEDWGQPQYRANFHVLRA